MKLVTKKQDHGAILEDWFESTAEKLPGVFYHRLSPKRRHGGQYTKKAPADHLLINQVVWLIDTKACGSDVFYFRSKFEHQWLAMERLRSLNATARCGFVVWFYKADPARLNLRFVEQFDKPARSESGIRFGWEMFY